MQLKLLAATYISSARSTRVICIRKRQTICLICIEIGYKKNLTKRQFWRFKCLIIFPALIRLSSHVPNTTSESLLVPVKFDST